MTILKQRMPVNWQRLGLTLVVGGIGGQIFYMIGAPLPYMLGALTATMCLALGGVKLEVPNLFRRTWMVVLGVMLGSSFTHETWGHMLHWGGSFLAMLLFVIASGWVVMQFYVRVGGIDRTTAFFCASPGGLGEMAMLGPAVGGHERTIVLSHATRIVLVMFIVPPVYRLLAGYSPSAVMASQGALSAISLMDLAVLTAVGVVGAVIAKAIHLPAWQTIGPMVLSAIAHSTGVTSAKPPFELLAAAQVVIGCGAGARFSGAKARELGNTVFLAVVSTLGLLALSAVAAFIMSKLTGIDFKPLHLAYAPGGFAEMNLIALSLGIEVAFVAIHHLGRVFFLVVGGTLMAKYYFARRPAFTAQHAGDD